MPPPPRGALRSREPGEKPPSSRSSVRRLDGPGGAGRRPPESTYLPPGTSLHAPAAMKLTLLSKLFISLVVLGTAGFVLWHFYGESPKTPDPALAKTEDAGTAASAAPVKRDPKRIVVGVNDFGGAYPGVVAN